jgi:ATP-dependent RNA helicase DDX19/DBP5
MATNERSLADRMTSTPTTTQLDTSHNPPLNPSGSTSWADEVSSPVTTTSTTPADTSKMQSTNGSEASMTGSTSLNEPEFDVEVKLSDIQADPNNPLYSIKNFDELGGL